MILRSSTIFGTLVLVLAFGVAVPAACGQSLADVARQKTTTKKAARVITDDDMPDRSNSSQPAEASSSTASSTGAQQSGRDGAKADDPTAKKLGTASAAGKQREEPKSEKLRELEAKRDTIKHDRATLEKKLDTMRQKAEQTDSQFRKNMYQEALTNQQTTLAQYDKQLKEVEESIEAEKQKSKQ